MRILCLNTWGGRLHVPLIAFLVSADADVFCLQEMIHTPLTTRDWLSYRDGGAELPQRANLFREIAEALPGHQAHFCPAARGDLFYGDTPVPSEWGIATFIRKNIPVIGQLQDFIYGDFSPDSYGPHPRARNAHAVRLVDYEAGHAVTIVHLHGIRELSGKGDTEARAAQCEALVGIIRAIAKDGDRLVVCGDFNLLPDSATFATLCDLGLTDLVTARGHDDTRTSYYGKAPRYSDYMLVSGNVEVRSFEVVASPEVSDHRPLHLEIG